MNSILNFIPEVTSSEESPIEVDGEIIAWHVVLFDKNKNALGGGFNELKETARRIAIAEVLERKMVRELKNTAQSEDFKLGEFPSTCGFAAGFDLQKTRYRAIAEGVERWAWSKWIDEHFLIDRIENSSLKLTKSGKFFTGFFDSVLFFQKKINTSNIPNFVEEVELGIVLGFKENGIFPGSRVAGQLDEVWDHALVEAWRHLDISKKHKDIIKAPFPYGRILHFSQNGEEGFAQVNNASILNWPLPQSSMIHGGETNTPGVYLWRALMKDFISWDKGDHKRFVY